MRTKPTNQNLPVKLAAIGAALPTLVFAYATGPDATLAGVANAVTVTVAGVRATVVGAALAPGNAGLYQIAVPVPGSISDGGQPLVAQVSGIASPSNFFLSVQR
jgi:uncharacterized protein (TIGR03437 family)